MAMKVVPASNVHHQLSFPLFFLSVFLLFLLLVCSPSVRIGWEQSAIVYIINHQRRTRAVATGVCGTENGIADWINSFFFFFSG